MSVLSFRFTAGLAIALGLSAALFADAPGESRQAFDQADAAWRKWRLERLSSETGWLTLIGLDWLKPGDNRLGSASDCDLELPAGKAPAHLGIIHFADGKATLTPDPAATGLRANGQSVSGPVALATDNDGDPTLLELGPLNFYVIRRGDRFGLRIRDREADLRLHFPGLDYYPADPKYRVVAKFTPNPPGSTYKIVDVIGVVADTPSPGKLTFTLDGRTYTLTALDDTGDGRLFMIIGDRTNGRETYGAGRFVYTDPPQDGETILDLNRLYNPPCAFTPYSTCPLPPPGNRLPIPIEAGEKKFAGELAHP